MLRRNEFAQNECLWFKFIIMNKLLHFNYCHKFNIYDFLIVSTIVSLVYGASTFVGELVTPVRFIGFLGAPFLVLNFNRLIKIRLFRNWLFFSILWALYMLMSVLWTSKTNFNGLLLYLFHYFSLLSCFLLMLLFVIKANRPLESIICGWGILCILTFPVAFWELITGNHLPSGSYNEGSMIAGEFRRFAAVTYQNLNSYVVILCFSLPFVSLPLFFGNESCFIGKKTSILINLCCVYILVVNASRGGFFCVIVSLLLLFFLLYNKCGRFFGLLLFLVIAYGVIYVVYNYEDFYLFYQISSKLNNQTFEGDIRVDLISDGLNIAFNQRPFGGGIGSMVHLYEQYSSCRIKFAHNFYVEFLMEFGLVLFALFFGLFYYSMCRINFKKWDGYKYVFLYSILSSFVLFVIDDYYLIRSGIWVYISSLVSVSYLSNKS